MGMNTVGHHPLYVSTLCLPNVTSCDKICRPSPPYLHTATNQMLEVGTVWKQAYHHFKLRLNSLSCSRIRPSLWPQIYSISLTLHWKQLAEIRVGTKIGRAFEYQKAKVNFLGQGCSMPFIFQVGLRALPQPQTHTPL